MHERQTKKEMAVLKSGQPLSAYLDQSFSCSCGRQHYAPLKQVYIGAGALERLPDILDSMGLNHPFLIADKITYQIAGEKCAAALERAGSAYKIVQLQHIEFDEATLGELLLEMPKECDVCVAVGAGSINDMTRLFSYKVGRPFITVATAAPMDGFASSIAAVYCNKMKKTFDAQPPVAILGDTDVLKNAPYRMITAGLGDLLGKVTCLCDWKLSRLINGEHYCEEIVEMVETCAEHVLANAEKARNREGAIIEDIMEGLVLAGVSMSLYGNSRPASGCEHHISHYWEMTFEQKGKGAVLHGTQVGIGTVLILKLVEKLLKTPVDFEAARKSAQEYDATCWEEKIKEAYGAASDGIIQLERTAKKNEPSGRRLRIDAIETNWEEIRTILAGLPAADYVAGILRTLESPCSPCEIGVDAAMLRRTLLYCKEVRNRYTILQLLWDLDLLETLTEEVIDEVYSCEYKG